MTSRFWRRLRARLNPRRADRDLADELDFHLARETHELTSRGVAPGEAHRQARTRFGSTAGTAAEDRFAARGGAIGAGDLGCQHSE